MIAFHCGDYGDLVAALPSIKAFGGGEIQIGDTNDPRNRRESMRGARYEAIKPLLKIQPYVTSVSWTDRPNGVIDFSNFRHSYRLHENLALAQARHVKAKISLKPWLTVPEIEKHGRVVIARSSRYHNPVFPWRKLLNKYPNPLFIGLTNEYKDFKRFGDVEYVPTANLLEAAKIVAGAPLVISNQTCCWWLAAGLGVKSVIQETMERDQNSVIERPNYFYTRSIEETQALIDSL